MNDPIELSKYLSDEYPKARIVYSDELEGDNDITMWRSEKEENKTMLRVFYKGQCTGAVLFWDKTDLEKFLAGLQEFAYEPRTTKS